jgi:hypothetical protein
VLSVKLEKGKIFGPQPFLAFKSVDGKFFHDNLDVQEQDRVWSYVFDEQTLPVAALLSIGVGAAGRYGKYSVKVMEM